MPGDLMHQTSRWTIADALKVHADDPTTTMPVIAADFPTMSESVMIWDTGALRDINMNSVTVNGWHVIWSLAADKVDLTNANIAAEWANRNNTAYIGFWYSKTGNGSDWIWGGRLLQKSADLRPWEWSGNLVMREGSENTVDMFYTSCGPVNNDFESVIAVSTGQIHTDDQKVWFTGFDTTVDMFDADGVHEANEAEDPYFDFRDPCPFLNPDDGRVYCVYETNVAGMRGQFVIGANETGPIPPNYTVDPGAGYGAASIGLAILDDGAYEAGDFSRARWTQLGPIVSALGVNDQTERPHVVFQNGKLYLFTISHHSTYSGNLQGPDGVYGFVSDNGLAGPFRPMNASGLVLGNPSSQPYSTYSHFVDAQGYVQSFIDHVPTPTATDPNAVRIGATLAPTVKLVLDDDRSYLTEIHNYGEIFAQRAWPATAAG